MTRTRAPTPTPTPTRVLPPAQRVREALKVRRRKKDPVVAARKRDDHEGNDQAQALALVLALALAPAHGRLRRDGATNVHGRAQDLARREGAEVQILTDVTWRLGKSGRKKLEKNMMRRSRVNFVGISHQLLLLR